MNRRLHEIFNADIYKNIATLSGAQVASYIFPIITLPYLARVLGPAGLGTVAFAQSFALCVSLPVEYGLSLSGARLISKERESDEKIAQIFTGAIYVKILISCMVCLGAYSVHNLFPIFRNNQPLFWSSIFFGISFSSSMLWYYEGLEKMRIVAMLDIFPKGIGALCIFIFINDPLDSWKVLYLQGIGFLIVTIFISMSALRNGLLKSPSSRLVYRTIKIGWPMFVFRSSESFYQMGASLFLGIFASPTIVGYYSGAERMAKIFVGLLLPINRAMYPRMSRLVQQSIGMGKRLIRISLIVSGGTGLAIFLVANLLAPFITESVLGSQFSETVPIFRILAVLPFLIALKQVFGFQWMLAMGMDKMFNTIIIICGISSLAAIALLVPWFYHYGMAFAVVATELSIPISIYIYLKCKGLSPI